MNAKVLLCVAGVAALSGLAGLVGTACDKPAGPAPQASASAGASSPAADAARPAEPKAPTIRITARGASVDLTPYTGSPLDWRVPAAALLAKKPHVAGENVVVNVLRDARMPKIEAIAWALREAKAKGVILRSHLASGAGREVLMTFHGKDIPACSAKVTIEKDLTITVTSAAGGKTVHIPRYSKGADLPRARDLLRQRSAACDSPVWTFSAAETVPWALPFDFVTGLGETDGGGPLRATDMDVAEFVPPDAGKAVPVE